MGTSAISLAWTLANSRPFVQFIDAKEEEGGAQHQENEANWRDTAILVFAHLFGIGKERTSQ